MTEIKDQKAKPPASLFFIKCRTPLSLSVPVFSMAQADGQGAPAKRPAITFHIGTSSRRG